MFDLSLMLATTNPSIMLGSIRNARGTIEDSTGNIIISVTGFISYTVYNHNYNLSHQ